MVKMATLSLVKRLCVWKEHVKRVQGGGIDDGVSVGGIEGSALDFSDQLCQPISREELR